jgi:hypothetical protein
MRERKNEKDDEKACNKRNGNILRKSMKTLPLERMQLSNIFSPSTMQPPIGELIF